MEKPKPTQNHEQERPKTLEDYAVKTFPADLDVTIRPLTVIRSGKDGGGIRDDEGWTPGDMLCVRKEGIGPIELFVKVHKPIKVYGGHVYEEHVIATKIVSLKKLQSREVNKSFNESYIQELYGKSTEEMIEEGERAAEQISNSSVVEEGGSDLERSKVSLKIGSTAVKATGIKKPITNKVETNEPVREPVKTNEVGVESVKKPVKIDKVGTNPADLVATEPVEKPVEADKASATPADLLAAKSVENPVTEKSMETNETNAGILPEDFKAAINEFKRLTKDNNNQFAGVARSLTGSLSEFRESITRTPTAIKDPRITEFTLRISELEASRVEILNSFIDEGFSEEMFVDSKKDPAKATGILVRKLEGLGEILRGVYAGYSGRDSLVQAIDEVIVDLSTVSRDRWGILDAVNKIKSVWGDDKS